MIAFAHDNIIPMPQKSNEWYTPARYIEAAREVMGSIDLDPASSYKANQTVKATKFYTREDNGLIQSWFGNVWLNPPYEKIVDAPVEKRSSIGKWIEKLIQSYQSGDIEQSVLLATSRSDTAWFTSLWDYVVCFADHPVKFDLLYGRATTERSHASYQSTHIHGTIFVYLGTNEQRFIDIFSQFGTVARRVSKPKERPVMLSLWGDA